ncbi:unnamed protein product [marine sediment metagenome]|uniref:Uncharacterized protein n=1 Tax=marine sediment metagenome TaxID=412755 RepID=X1KFS9_9ZZZZ
MQVYNSNPKSERGVAYGRLITEGEQKSGTYSTIYASTSISTTHCRASESQGNLFPLARSQKNGGIA